MNLNIKAKILTLGGEPRKDQQVFLRRQCPAEFRYATGTILELIVYAKTKGTKT